MMRLVDCYERIGYGGDNGRKWDHAINQNLPRLRTMDEASCIVEVFSLINGETFNPEEKSRDHALCIEFEAKILRGFLHLYNTYKDFLYPMGLCRKSNDVRTYLKSAESVVTHYVLTFLIKPSEQHQAAFAFYDYHCRCLARLVPVDAKDIVYVFLK